METLSQTLFNRKEIVAEPKSTRRNNRYRQFLLTESERFIRLSDVVVSPKESDNSLEVLEEDDSGDDQGELADIIRWSEEVTPAVQKHSHPRMCHCRGADRKKVVTKSNLTYVRQLTNPME